MSADNYAVCPQCITNAEYERANAQREANEQYGKISQDKYLALVRIAEYDKAENIRGAVPTLREDYTIGVYDNGEFRIEYSCNCHVCGFSYTYSVNNGIVTKSGWPSKKKQKT